MLTGDFITSTVKISLKAMIKCLRTTGHRFWIECNRLEVGEQGKEIIGQEQSPIPAKLLPTVNNYKEVFAGSVGLPPSRGCEHAINLKTGSDAVGVRPYRYP